MDLCSIVMGKRSMMKSPVSYGGKPWYLCAQGDHGFLLLTHFRTKITEGTENEY